MLPAGLAEVIDWSLYDETCFSPADEYLSRTFFSMPVGFYERSVDRYKSFIKTNMAMCGMVPMPNSFVISRLNIAFLNDFRVLRLHECELYRHMAVTLVIGNRIMYECPAWQCVSPFALFDSPKQELATVKEEYGADWNKIGAVFDPPFQIRTQEYFTVKTELDRPVREKIWCACHLDGKLLTPVLT